MVFKYNYSTFLDKFTNTNFQDIYLRVSSEITLAGAKYMYSIFLRLPQTDTQ